MPIHHKLEGLWVIGLLGEEVPETELGVERVA